MHYRHSGWTPVAALLIVAAGAAVLFAQSPPSQQVATLPTAGQIIERYIAAIGGRDTFRKITNRHIRGTAEFAPTLIGAIQIFEKAPNLLLVDIELEGRRIREGFDGTVGWTADPTNGVVEKSAEESFNAGRGASFYGLLHQLERYSKITVEGRVEIGERQAYKLEGVLRGRGTETLCYDVETGLLLRRVNIGPPPALERSESNFSDYREVDGLKYPFTHRMVSGGRTLILRAIEIRHNVPMDDALFAKPAVP